MFELKTKRLRLIPLKYEYLEMLSNSRKEMELALGLNESFLNFSDDYKVLRTEAFMFWLENAHNLETDYRWHTNWEIVLVEENRSIGGMSFLGAPNRKGEVILGFIADVAYRKMGYMTEAVTAISDWAITFGEAKRVISFTNRESEVIDKLLAKCGFRKEVIYVKE